MSFPMEDDQIRRAQLQMQFHGTRKGDQETIESYVKRLKSLANSLAEIGSSISDSDIVLQLLAGLPSQYFPLQKTISSKWPLPTFEEACSLVHKQEEILLQDHGEQIPTDGGIGGADKLSAFFTVENFVAVVGTVSTVVAAVGTLGTVVGAMGAVGAASASRMIVVGAVGAVSTVVAGWKIWQAIPHK